MACSVCPSTLRCSSRSSLLLSCPSKCSRHSTRSRGRISMAMATSGSNDGNDVFVPDQKLVIPENSHEVLCPLYKRFYRGEANMQSTSSRKTEEKDWISPMYKKTEEKDRTSPMYNSFNENDRYFSRYKPNSTRKNGPPDIASMMHDEFIVWINLPLVSLVTELIIAQIIQLNARDPYEPIKMHLNSTGTRRADGQVVAFESEGFAIYDAMNAVSNEFHTYCMGSAFGMAALLLAAGKKGRRYLMPNCIVRLEEPCLPGTGQIPAVDLQFKAEKQLFDRGTTVKLLAKHTGNPEEIILRAMKRAEDMTPRRTIEFGLADKILWSGVNDKKKPITDAVNLEEWDKREGIEVVRPYGERENSSI